MRSAIYELIQFIFHPGFSTAEQVSEISGRGMGMDIVLAKIQGLNGHVEVDSQPGDRHDVPASSCPLTMAIATTVLVEIGGETYAIPVENAGEILEVPAQSVRMAHGQRVFRLRDRGVPRTPAERFLRSRRGGGRAAGRR